MSDHTTGDPVPRAPLAEAERLRAILERARYESMTLDFPLSRAELDEALRPGATGLSRQQLNALCKLRLIDLLGDAAR